MTERLRRILCAGLFAVLAACGSAPDDLTTLQRGMSGEPESLDPQKARSVQAADVLRDIREGLVSYSPSGEIVPGLATHWAVSDDNLTYTFYLRDDAGWSTGDPVVAADVVRGLRRLVDPATNALYAGFVGDIVNASEIIAGDAEPDSLGVTAIDDYIVTITVERPIPYLLSLLTHPSTFPAHPDADDTGINNGAYRLVEWEPASIVRLERNEHYWNNAATAIDKVNYHILPEDLAQLNRYRSGELHTTDNVPPQGFSQLRDEFGEQLRVSNYLGTYYYGFNMTKPPFRDNLDLRRALSMAVDRDTLVEKVTGRGELPAWSWVPNGVSNYSPPTFSYSKLTQEERNNIARGLYRSAGYSKDNPLRIEFRYNTSATERTIAVAIQSMWADVLGVETTLINEEFQVLVQHMAEKEITQVFRGSWVGDYDDATTFLNLLSSDDPSNMTGYASDEFDRLMERAAVQGDPDHRRLFLEEAEGVALADQPLIPIYFYVSKSLVSPYVKGWEDNILNYHYSQHLRLEAAD